MKRRPHFQHWRGIQLSAAGLISLLSLIGLFAYTAKVTNQLVHDEQNRQPLGAQVVAKGYQATMLVSFADEPHSPMMSTKEYGVRWLQLKAIQTVVYLPAGSPNFCIYTFERVGTTWTYKLKRKKVPPLGGISYVEKAQDWEFRKHIGEYAEIIAPNPQQLWDFVTQHVDADPRCAPPGINP